MSKCYQIDCDTDRCRCYNQNIATIDDLFCKSEINILIELLKYQKNTEKATPKTTANILAKIRIKNTLDWLYERKENKHEKEFVQQNTTTG